MRSPTRTELKIGLAAGLVFVLSAAAFWALLPVRPRFALSAPEYSGLIGFSPDGKMLATRVARQRHCNFDGAVQLWDATTGREQAAFVENSDTFRGGAFSSDGKLLAVDHYDNDTKRWGLKLLEVATRQECASVWLNDQTGFLYSEFQYRFFPSGQMLAFSGQENGETCLKLWDVANCHEQATFRGLGQRFDISPDGRTMAASVARFAWPDSIPQEDSIKVWDVATLQERATLHMPNGYVQSLGFSPDSQTLAATCVVGGRMKAKPEVRLWDVSTWREAEVIAGASWFSFALDGRELATGHRGRSGVCSVKLWDIAPNGAAIDLKPHQPHSVVTAPGYNVQISGDGRMLVMDRSYKPEPNKLLEWSAGLFGHRWSLEWRKDLIMLDAKTGEEIGVIPNCGDMFTSCSPDSTLLATVSKEGTIQVWDIPPRKSVGQVIGWSALLAIVFAVVAWWWARRMQKRRARLNAEGA